MKAKMEAQWENMIGVHISRMNLGKFDYTVAQSDLHIWQTLMQELDYLRFLYLTLPTIIGNYVVSS
jgi:hypothetical protein